MTPSRQRMLMQGQSSIARKVFEGVPIQEAYTPNQIGQALARSSGAMVDPHILRGCLNSLRDSGLVREVGPNLFRRAEVRELSSTPKEEKPTMAMPKIAAAPTEPADTRPKAPATTIDLLSGIAGRLRAFANRTECEIHDLANEIEAAALQIEESKEADARDLNRLKQLQALLKDL